MIVRTKKAELANFLRKTSLNKELPFHASKMLSDNGIFESAQEPLKLRVLDRKGEPKAVRLLFNKKAELESLIKTILWIVFFGIALLALYALFRRFVY